MTDRFYPKGKQSAEGVWKSTYEVANELRSHERSPFPPGTSVHQPGAREMFGYSTPGPVAHRLANPALTLTETVGVTNPREHHAISRSEIANDRDVFEMHDVPEMSRSYRSPMATATTSMSGFRKSKNTRSLPALQKPTPIAKLSTPNPNVDRLEDDHFSYYVPASMSDQTADQLYQSTSIPKLSKERRISFPFDSKGTGFKSQGGETTWWPEGKSLESQTSYRSQFGKAPNLFNRPPKADKQDPVDLQ